MANLFLYHANILCNADLTISGGNIESSSSPYYAADDRLSYKLTATGVATTIRIDQPGSAIDPFRYLVLIDHNMVSGTAVVSTYTNAARTTATVVFSGSVGSDDPSVTDLGSVLTGKQYVDVRLIGSGSTHPSVGELMLASIFTSPQRPQLGIDTNYQPRRTFIEFPNGEVGTIRHGGTVRQKSYVIPSLSLTDAALWIDLFKDGEGAELVVLSDDEGDVYPAYMNQTLSMNTSARKVSINLTFTEVKL
jgi:hypothetical protein